MARTTLNSRRPDDATWLASPLPGVSMLRAHYRSQRFARHTHETFVVGVNERGAHRSWFRGGNMTCPTRAIMIIPPDEVHSGERVDGYPWHYRALYIAPELFAEIADVDTRAKISTDGLLGFRSFEIHDTTLVDEFLSMHRRCEQAVDALEGQELIAQWLMALTTRHGASVSAQPRAQPTRALAQARDYLHAHCAESLRLDVLANVAGLSRFHFLRAFSRVYGLAPHAYLTQLRIERARTRIAAGEPLTSVALGTGFVDQSHLNRSFKQLVGVTPGQYQRATMPGRRQSSA